MPRILLHICCAVCATSVVERLREENWEVDGFFYNPNIHPEEEYQKRLQETKHLAKEYQLPLIAGDYEKDKWLEFTKGLEEEKEGGRRCQICFQMRLEKTKQLAQEKGYAKFTTTLSVSPHKNSSLINEIGVKVGGDLYLGADFKKRAGFKKALELAKKYNLYQQNYCGCVFSKLEREKAESGAPRVEPVASRSS